MSKLGIHISNKLLFSVYFTVMDFCVQRSPAGPPLHVGPLPRGPLPCVGLLLGVLLPLPKTGGEEEASLLAPPLPSLKQSGIINNSQDPLDPVFTRWS